ncbi:NADH-quinone oxidoreductase subunit G [Cellulomonas dongxiuzhuiae]|uniref:NADH-quinone oxidoreductase n=1 Tax=Cellulomonas dongxiuzhuiae TaxID=2819979 RepID=A0ABX8GHS2_9CELL|nr:NADH-quinone oxidoreductase subunit G [Cellulomonas dongxiuzhuiae]MBO3088407.1 NADH-quinone oxidoreductase subunit G [Cellulomonas dongxiuzhuiae]MBO3094259.1 NADH-quinone oxidoreductase subunit G [Cellulomonas dongxiuzhuiae]QWC15307.1 NADH-quinone oxidoreductase subunit G [Cellulomonas dongxiuzhuiae]
MTTTTPRPTDTTPLVPAAPPTVAPEPAATVTFTVDGIETTVPKGTLVIRAAEQLGIQIPRFCDHPLLAPAGACRQCLVEVWAPGRDGNVAKMPKPQASCTLEATPGMQVKTQHTSPEADKAQHGVMELLLINHPLDCPVCDKGGECPLQNQAMSNGRAATRFVDVKRTFPKPIAISTQVLLDRERCILCQRCTRFSEEIAGDVWIDLQKRGAAQQIGTFDTRVLGFAGDAPVGASTLDTSGRPFASYFSGNTVQICPVGALTSAAYRFRSRPFDLVSAASIAEHDANGSAIRVDHRRGVVLRRLAGDDPAVNQEWITDKDRFAFHWQSAPDRVTTPLVRRPLADGTRGELEPCSWTEALDTAAAGLRGATVGVLPGGRLTLEDAYAYSKLARTVLGTNDVDHRARPHSAEEETFLGHHVAGRTLRVTFGDLVAAPAVLCVGYEPEEEGGIAFLRLRSSVVAGRTRVFAVAALASRGIERLDGTLLAAAPGTEPEVLDAITTGADDVLGATADALGAEGSVILVGERAATVPGALTAVLRLAERTGARVAWIPRRAGERGAIEAGTLPTLLPGGRPVADPSARVDVAAVWGVDDLPTTPGRSADEILAAAAAGRLGALVVGGVDPADHADPVLARAALDAVPFLVSLEVRRSEVTDRADVVLPVAPPVEKAGTFVTWEGRPRPFAQVLTTTHLSDFRVLDRLADAMGADLGLLTLADVHAELDQLGGWDGGRVEQPATSPAEPPAVPPGHAVLATWHQLLDAGRLQDGEPYLAGTAKQPVARVSPVTAQAAGLADGDDVAVSTDRGTVTAAVQVTDMADHVVWLPTNPRGAAVRDVLGGVGGTVVRLAPAGRSDAPGVTAHAGSGLTGDTAEAVAGVRVDEEERA